MNTVKFIVPFNKLEPEERESFYGSSRIGLCQRPDSDAGRRYLRKRGLDCETIAKFRLGYVPFSIGHALSGRIVIPVFNNYSDLIALSFRPIFDIIITTEGKWHTAVELKKEGNDYTFFDENDKQHQIGINSVAQIQNPQPKYWNESYAKAEHLFGLNLAIYSILKDGFAIVCEGQFDVMAMHSQGIKNVVGMNGSALCPVHVMLLKRWTDQLVLLMDGDEAGRAASERAKELLDIWKFKSQSLFESAITCLPEDSDPDDYLARHGSYFMRKLIGEAMLTSGLTYPKRWVA